MHSMTHRVGERLGKVAPETLPSKDMREAWLAFESGGERGQASGKTFVKIHPKMFFV